MQDAPQLDRERLIRALEIQRRVSSERDLDKLAQVVMSEITALLGGDRSSLFLFDWNTMELQACVAEGLGKGHLVVPLRMGLVGTAILRRETINLTNAHTSPYFNSDIDAALDYQTDSLLVVPMLGSGGRVLGGVELLNKATGRFTHDDEMALNDAAQRLARWIERDEAYPAGIEAEMLALCSQVACDRGSVFVVEARTGRLVTIYANGGNGRPISLNLKLGIAGQAAVTGNSMLIDDAWEDPRFDRSFDQRTGYRTHSMICVPLQSASREPLGVIQVINKREGVFSADDLATLEAVAGIVAIAIENAMLFEEQEKQFLSLVDALAKSMDYKDPLSVGLIDRIAARAVAIGREMGYSEDELDQLRVAAMLLDCGMLGVDEQVLKKPDTLDEAEFEHVRAHVSRTEEILARIHFSRKYRKVPWIAAAHHECLDGSGYPRGLRANEIPFMSKILTVADVYEALVADRYYRPKLPREDALSMLERGIGKRFDRNVVDALMRTLAREDQAWHDCEATTGPGLPETGSAGAASSPAMPAAGRGGPSL